MVIDEVPEEERDDPEGGPAGWEVDGAIRWLVDDLRREAEELQRRLDMWEQNRSRRS